MEKENKFKKFVKDHDAEIAGLMGAIVCVTAASVWAKKSYKKGIMAGAELSVYCLSASIEDDKVFDKIIEGMDKELLALHIKTKIK